MTKDLNKGVIILSGGLDSSTLLRYLVKEKNYEMEAISFHYGQNHSKRELECAKKQCEELKVPYRVIDISFLKQILNSSLLNGSKTIPEGHYEEENMKSTVVPNRNMIMASIAVARACSIHADFVALGVHAGDHAIYPDCREEFIDAFRKAVELADWNECTIIAPFQNMDKGQIVKKGIELGVNFKNTHTCYKGENPPCEKCGSCLERAEGFELNNFSVPLLVLYLILS